MIFLALFLFACLQPLVFGISSKKGVVLWGDDHRCGDFEKLNKIGWWYDWRNDWDYYLANETLCPPEVNCQKDRYVPMRWGFYNNTNYSDFPDNADVLLGCNEPNSASQSNLTPQEAAEYWPQFENASGGRYLVSCATARCGSCQYNETEWHDAFFAACPNCRVDGLGVHTYWCGAEKTMDHLEYLYNRYNRTIWLTEFCCRQDNNNPDRVLEFMKKILPMLEAAPYVSKYSWYKLKILDDSGWVKTSCSLMGSDGSLTALGEYYNGFGNHL